MSRLRVRWWSLIKSVPLLFVVSASKHELEMRMGVRLFDGWPSPLSCDADMGRPLPGLYIISCDNLFYKRRELGTKRTWPFQKDIGLHERLKLFKLNFLHGFPFSKTQRSAKCLTEQYMNSTGLILQLCVSLAHGGLAVLPDWLWWFLLPPCVYSPVFSFNVVPAAECSSNDGWWRLKHAERRVKSQYALFISVSMNNQWNKVFLSVSGELKSVTNECFFQVNH